MYDFPEVAGAHDAVWRAVAARLGPGAPAALDRTLGPPEQWAHPRLLFGQSCGWPLVQELRGRVAVVGTLVHAGVSEPAGRYRSVLVARAGDARDLTGFRGGVAAVNDPGSLSGCVSLGAAVAPLSPEGRPFFARVTWTGAHVESMAAVARGDADLAAIDGVTWALLGRHRPSAVAGLGVVGHGPSVLSLPLVTRFAADVPRLRAAVVGALADPGSVDALEALGIAGFCPLDAADYDVLLPLGDLARRALPAR